MATETKTFYPGAHDSSQKQYGDLTYPTNPVGKGSSNTTRALIDLTKGSNAETYIFWPFDLSSIPSDATIDSVSCQVKAYISAASSTYVKSYTAQLYSGNTAKGSSYSLPASAKVFSLSTGTWTREELSKCRLRFYAMRGTSSTSYNVSIYFYGADLTVVYTYQSEEFMLKLGGAWHDIARVFKKVNGIWIEQTDLANVIPDNVRYQNGGEIIPPKPVVTITGTGNSSYSYVTINGTKYTKSATVEVEEGTTIAAYVGRGTDMLEGVIEVDGVDVLTGVGTYNYTVTGNCAVKLSAPASLGTTYGVITITTG